MYFLGYPPGKKGWQVYDLETQQAFFFRDVKFEGTIFPFPISTTEAPATLSGWAWLDSVLDASSQGEASPTKTGGMRFQHRLTLFLYR